MGAISLQALHGFRLFAASLTLHPCILMTIAATALQYISKHRPR